MNYIKTVKQSEKMVQDGLLDTLIGDIRASKLIIDAGLAQKFVEPVEQLRALDQTQEKLAADFIEMRTALNIEDKDLLDLFWQMAQVHDQKVIGKFAGNPSADNGTIRQWKSRYLRDLKNLVFAKVVDPYSEADTSKSEAGSEGDTKKSEAGSEGDTKKSEGNDNAKGAQGVGSKEPTELDDAIQLYDKVAVAAQGLLVAGDALAPSLAKIKSKETQAFSVALEKMRKVLS